VGTDLVRILGGYDHCPSCGRAASAIEWKLSQIAIGLVIGASAIVMVACGDDANPSPPSYMEGCSSDTDCEANLVCAAPVFIATFCTMPCKKDEDCPDGSVCPSNTRLCFDWNSK
jgi:hypothetical protein